MICVLLSAKCDGRLQKHHVLPQQLIKRAYKTFRYQDDLPRMTEREALGDTRNLVHLCWYHHQLVENRRVYLCRRHLPTGITAFASSLGLAWFIGEHVENERGAAF